MFIIDDILIGTGMTMLTGFIIDSINQRIRNKQIRKVMDKTNIPNPHFSQKAFELGYKRLGKHLRKHLK